jgi:deoxyribodipyrimidine photo-lyase
MKSILWNAWDSSPDFSLNVPLPGEKAALNVLYSFLDERGRTYRKDMSSPKTGWDACSRLSPYLAAGCITIRQILHHTRRKQKKVKVNPRSKENLGWTSSLSSFQSRPCMALSFHPTVGVGSDNGCHCLESRIGRASGTRNER